MASEGNSRRMSNLGNIILTKKPQTEKEKASLDASETGAACGGSPGAGAGPVQTGADFETAISLAGSGLFTYGILVAAGIIFLTSGLQNGINAYILPAAKCDFDLSSAQMGALNAFFLAGGMASSYLWGIMADAIGRRPILVWTLIADALCTLASTLSQSYAVFAVFRFLNGAIIGGPSSLAFLYIGEFVADELRPKFSLIVGGFWAISWMMLPGLAWLVLPQPWEVPMGVLGVTFNSWRVMLALLAVPSLFSAFLAWRFPETPQFLMTQGRLEEAMAVLRVMYMTNTGGGASPDSYPVKTLALPAGTDDAGADPGASSASSSTGLMAVLRVARRMCRQALGLLRPPVLPRTLLACAITFTNMFSYYGLALWLPELFNRFEVHNQLHPEQSMAVCELTRNWPAHLAELEELRQNQTAALTLSADSAAASLLRAATGPTKCRSADAVNEAVFLQTLVISSVCLAATVLSAIIAKRVGRRTLPLLLNVAAGVLAGSIYFVESTTANLVVSSLFQALIGTANTAINGFLCGIFPPRISALGVCSAILAGRVGGAVSNLVFGLLLEISCEVPIFLIAGVAIASGLLCVLLQAPWGKAVKGTAATGPAQPHILAKVPGAIAYIKNVEHQSTPSPA